MRKFSDFGIKPKTDRFVGDKIKIAKILNQEIIVHGFKLDKSRYEKSNSDKCLHLQIEFKGSKFLLFTGSKILADAIQQVPKDQFPFQTTITQEGEAFQFN